MKIARKKFIKGLICSPLVLFCLSLLFVPSFLNFQKVSYAETGYLNNNIIKRAYVKSKSIPKKIIAQEINAASTTPPIQYGYCLTVPVLMYHHVQPMDVARQLGQASLTVDNGIFDQQMAYLSLNGYTSLSADQLINALRSHSGLPPKSIVVTFDDGYKDIVTYAYPILQKYRITGNLMIPTGLIENNGYLSWSDLKNMTGSGLIFAYDHTWSHASLGGVSSEKAQTEIMTAKTQLEQNLGKPVNIFAYPYGSESGQIVSLLSQDGFWGAFSTIGGWAQCDSFIMTLHRNRVGNSALSSYGL